MLCSTQFHSILYIFYKVANLYDLARTNLYILWKIVHILQGAQFVGIRTNDHS